MRIKIIVLGFLFSIASYSQHNNQKVIDSLLKQISFAKNDTAQARIYIKLENEFRSSNPVKGLVYAEKCLAIVKKMKWQKGLAICYNDIGNNYSDRGLHELSLKNFLESLKNSVEYPNIKVMTLGNIANLYLKQGNYEMVSKYNNEALKIATTENFLDPKASAFQKSGFIYEKKKDWQKAKLAFKNSLNIHKELGNKYKEANLLMNIGDVSLQTTEKIDYYLTGYITYLN